MSEARPDWVASDLDGTLFSRSPSPGAIAATWNCGNPAGDTGDSRPSSWMPAPRHAFFARLVAIFRLVPVTARDLTSFSRVRIPGVPLRDGAILANGAILLSPDSMTPDLSWTEEISPLLAEWSDTLKEMIMLLRARGADRVLPRLVESHGTHPAYLVAKAVAGFWQSSEGLELRAALDPFGCRTAVLGRELQVLPPPVSKRLGLLAFSQRFCAGAPPLLALGDAAADLGFLREAVFMAAPTDSELAQALCHES